MSCSDEAMKNDEAMNRDAKFCLSTMPNYQSQ